MNAKKKTVKKSPSTKSSGKVKDLQPRKDAKGGTEVRRYDIVGAFPKKLEFSSMKSSG